MGLNGDAASLSEIRPCPVCASSEVSATFELAERMFGMAGTFVYAMCRECEALRIGEVPPNLADYYPSNYCGFREAYLYDYERSFKDKVLRYRDRYEWTGTGLMGKWLAKRRPNPADRTVWPLKLKLSDRILDVGCGGGSLLRKLQNLGYRNLTGIDPYMAEPAETPGLSLKRVELPDFRGSFDVIMMHHVLEHIADQKGTMQELKRLLAPGGKVLIRIPTISCDAWDMYRECWYQLDAPRHLILHSRKSFARLAEESGFEIEHLWDDSGPDQFLISELYRQGKPLHSASRGYADYEEARQQADIALLQKRADELNAKSRGDMFGAVLRVRPGGSGA